MNTPIVVIGTVATDPKPIITQSGVPICSFRLASSERRFDRAQQRWVDGETNWFGVTVFRALADHARESLRKGERVIVSGRLRVRRWENEERSGTAVEIEAEALGHDLRWGVSRFEKRVGAVDSGEASAGGAEAAAAGGATGAEGGAPGEPGRIDSITSTGEPSEDGFLPAAA